MALWSVEDCERLILGNYYRLMTQGKDRRGANMDPVDPRTGLPLKESDLLPEAYAIRGAELALKVPCEPRTWAVGHLGLADTPKADWTSDDAGQVSELTRRFKLAMHRMSERGLMIVQPESLWDGKPMVLGEDGLTIQGKITEKGLLECEKVIKGTKLARGPVSVLHGMDKSAGPEWARKKYREEDK